ncbi:MAG TPA: protein translocase subunit SecF, partial [Isosphaeraceae bacterium]|nr:protein translocase subunit SecF [Isosphaeraceae bacterium]
ETQRSSFVREQAAEAKLPDVSIESLNVEGENRGTRFNVRTTETDSDKVQRQIRQQFGSALARLTVDVSKPQAIPEPPKDDEAGSAIAQRFAGGRAYTLTFNRLVKIEPVRAALSRIFREMRISNPDGKFEVEEVHPGENESTAKPQLLVRTSLSETQMDAALADLSRELPNDPNLLFERLEKFGAAVARDTQTLAMMAIVASWLVMIGYLWLRFKSVSYGLAAVIALVHDVLFTLGAVAISPYKIDLPMVAAFLTLIGFSVNDTIVIFDRMREIKGKSPVLTAGIVNAAVNQTLSRTILTSLTAWLVVLILYVFGGEGLHGFSFCLVVGFLTGTYSTIYIASPILVDWANWGEKKTKDQEKTEPVGSRS